jgi:hypothetical protein
LFFFFTKDWQNLYEASVHSLQSEDNDEPKPSGQSPFYLNRPSSIEASSSKINLFIF